MWRSLSTKLLLAVFAAVILPFGGFAFYLQDQIAGRMTTELVRKSLLGLAGDLAGDVNRKLNEVIGDLELWSTEPTVDFVFTIPEPGIWDAQDAVDLARWYAGVPDGHAEPLATGDTLMKRELTESFDRYVRTKPEFDLLLLVDTDGYLVCCSTIDRTGTPLPEDIVYGLFGGWYGEEPWFDAALQGGFALQDQHVSPFLHPEGPPSRMDQLATDFAVGMATPVYDKASGAINGVMYGLVNWRTFQELVDQSVVKDAFRGLVPGGEQPSPYAWIWGRDGDTILAHRLRSNYGVRISGEEIALPAMREDALSAEFGMYRDYVFLGKKKTAAFFHTWDADEGGYGWIVGVGINYDDIYKASAEQRKLLMRGTGIVLLLVLLWMSIIARRTTEPIAKLERHTRAVAAGDLSTRVHLARNDELGQLADAMNAMTRDLERNRAALVKAEKDAAWREMARQVAHDLKNPLTPIQLSLDLVERSRAEGSPQADDILERTLELMRRQVQSLRATATEFYEFTGGAPPEPVDLELADAVQRVLDLHRAWAEKDGIEVQFTRHAAPVHADVNKLERVLTNLVTNAFQAMDGEGRLELVVGTLRGRAMVRITDNGSGLSEEALERLFEPYFTTKSQGTGLGLAVSARFVEEMGGTLALEPRSDGKRGTTATLELPLCDKPT